MLLMPAGQVKNIDIRLSQCSLEEEEVFQIQAVYELQRDYYHSVFKRYKQQANIELYGEFEDYLKFQKLISTSRSKTGFFSKKMNAAIVYKHKGFLYTINHELSYLFIRGYIPRCTGWLNEGMSEFFEYFEYKDDRYQLRVQYQKIERVVGLFMEDKVDLRKLLRQTYQGWSHGKDKAVLYKYSISYALVLYLQQNKPDLLKKILLAEAQQKPLTKVIKNNYEGGLKKLTEDLRTYCQGLNEANTRVILL